MKCSNCGAEMSKMNMTWVRKQMWFIIPIMLLVFCSLLEASFAHGDNGGQEIFVVPEISEPPRNVQTMWHFYKPTKYIHIEKFDIHVLGTESVSDWMMRESSILIYNMVEALKSRRDR